MASPSLENILSTLRQKSANSASLRLCFQAVRDLSSAERNTLVASKPQYTLTAAEKNAFARAAVQALSADDVDDTLADAANGAYDAANNIFMMLGSIILNCACYDTQFGTNYTNGVLLDILVSYIKTMVDSVPLANEVAQYGEDFDNEVIAFCANTSLTVDERLSKIREYIATANGFETKAKGIQSILDSVKDQLVDLLNEMNNRPLPKWKKPSRASSVRATVPVPTPSFELGIALLDRLIATPLRPLIMIAGLLGLGNTEATNAAYAIAASEVVRSSARGPTSLTILHDLRSADDGGNVNEKFFSDFRDNMAVLNSYWNATIIDAGHIESWLEDGASWVDAPEYMKLNLDEGARTYVKVAKYLRSYATQIDSLDYDELLEAAGYA
ncbi:hypothetical protein BDV28DRAFT_133257 [Aspergillus coremiiformis]|uniref:Uncharacterized protein n=1 Tax=Aspergillus coremiiformis TaxID=138285 RepID=A0A5N6Z6U7_9EURO|nr:hypothetical protein BDV28DRAFT_133257 [Aspergillus coremiiformis]